MLYSQMFCDIQVKFASLDGNTASVVEVHQHQRTAPSVMIHEQSGACTMMVDEQILSYRISFELTKPNHSNPALLIP